MSVQGFKNVNLMSKEKFDSLGAISQSELYAVSGSGVSLPSDNYLDLSLGASGTTYTAPANGWVVFGKAASAAGQYINLSSGANVVQVISYASGNILSICLPVLKGKTFKASYTVAGATNSFRFIYGEGE